MIRRAALAAACAVSAAGSVAAQAPNPLDLSRGLRDNGQPDLALEFLSEIEKAKPSGEVLLLLPLERAKVRLALAQLETDEGNREAGIAGAKSEFQKFLKDNGKHPRAAEARVSLARVNVLQAKAQLVRATRLDKDKKPAAFAAARPLFNDAAKLFADAGKQLDGQLADAADPLRKAQLTREVLRAEIDHGICLYDSADTFNAQDANQVQERGKVLDTAKAIFDAVGKKDPTNPLCWTARAWVGACDLEKQDNGKAQDAFKRIRDAAKSNPAAADGVRMADFFEIQGKFLEARAKKEKGLISAARIGIQNWMNADKYRARITPERTSATYYFAHLTMLLGTAEVVFEPDPKDPKRKRVKGVNSNGATLLQQANREYKKLLEYDNDYTDRAAREQTQTIRYLVGNADQPAAAYRDFEQVHMAARLMLSRSQQERDDDDQEVTQEERKKLLMKALPLLERSRQLVAGAGTPKDIADVNLQLAFAYLQAERPGNAAVLGEALARTGKPANIAVRGGVLAVQAYLAAMNTASEDDKLADRERALSLAQYLDKVYPNDPFTDAVRFRLGLLHFEDKQFSEAFAVLGKVSPNYAGAANARTVQARAAYALLGRESQLSPQDKAQVFRKAVTDAEAVAEPGPGTEKNAAKVYLGLRTILANLQLMNPPDGYAAAERIAAAAGKTAAGFTQLSDAEKQAAGFAAEEVRLRAVYAQAAPFLKSQKYKEMADKLAPSLVEMAKGGPANVNLEGDAAIVASALDATRRDVILLGLQGKIKEGNIEQAAELFDLLDRLGGSAEATADALSKLVGLVRPQLDELKRAGRGPDADKLAGSVAGILEKQSAKPNPSVRTLTFLGKSLRELGQAEKSVSLFTKIPEISAEELRKPGDQQDEKVRPIAGIYQLSRLELARAYREIKQFDKADEILKPALGDAKKPGWAKALDFRREAAILLEDKAWEMPGGDDAQRREKAKGWGAARDAWNKLLGEYQGAITRQPKDADKVDQWKRDREKLIPVFLGLQSDLQRCLARANTQLIPDAAKRAESLGRFGASIADLEKKNAQYLNDTVRGQFAALLAEFPALKDGYTKAGGTEFAK
jgi:TolA-binding protein